MTPKTRQEHADLIQFLYKELTDDPYYVKLRPGDAVGRALSRAQALATFLALTVPHNLETAAELSGILAGAQMRSGTPRTQSEVVFIRDVLTVAQHANGYGYVTKADRRRVEWLFQQQARSVPEAAMEEGLYLHDGERRVVLRQGPQPVLIPAKLGLVNLANGTRVKFSTHLVYGVERVAVIQAIEEPERHRGILLWSVGEAYVVHRYSGHQQWIRAVGPLPEQGGAVTFLLKPSARGGAIAYDIRMAPLEGN